MTPEQTRQAFSAAYDGELTDEERRAFDATLAADAELSREYTAFCAALSQASAALQEPLDAPDLLPGVQQRLRARSRGRFYADKFAERAGTGPVGPLAVVLMLLAVVAVLSLFVALTGCSTSGRAQASQPDAGTGGGAAPAPAPDDRDADGVCDGTELLIGSDPDTADSDADGLPDFVEAASGFDPSDPDVPGLDQLASLRAQPNAILDFELRATADGMGQGHTGLFEAYETLDPEGLTARDYFVSGSAVSAEPPDNVRDVQPGAERFGAVTGRTRLTFRLRFEYHRDAAPGCVLGYPFRYSLKTDDGQRVASRDFLLLVLPDGASPEYCLPLTCV